ncbi:MAG: GNAT family N-acetyltransferase [Candidatus Gastranaerophilales bacterium]|nr:GNAT family N-acetyltransferase [Candidatus Gastranaerophilales bacterium]
MQQTNNFIVLNIREYLEDKKLGEDKLVKLLSEFSCPLNSDVERFLKQQSVAFAKKHQAVTYLVLSPENAELLGYFSITIKPLVIKAEPFSNTVKRKLARFSEIDQNEQTYNIAAYLIAQLGKNFNERVMGRITGRQLLEAAIRQTRVLQYQAGGMVTFVETDNKEKLLSFYESYGFKRFDTRQTMSGTDEPHELVQLLRLL